MDLSDCVMDFASFFAESEVLDLGVICRAEQIDAGERKRRRKRENRVSLLFENDPQKTFQELSINHDKPIVHYKHW